MAAIPIFDSAYIIDGLAMSYTPAQLLGGEDSPLPSNPIIDETLDPSPGGCHFEDDKINEYLRAVRKGRESFELVYASSLSRCYLAYSLIDSLWHKGSFVLNDLKLGVHLRWQIEKLGDGTALYKTAEAIGELASDMDLPIVNRGFELGVPKISFNVDGPKEDVAVGGKLVSDEDSWIIYMPFDTDDFHLGGSALSAALGLRGGISPKMEDPDYFMDCYEVLREFVEDGILLSASTVGRGGLLSALDKITSRSVGAGIDISELKRAYPTADVTRILFSEVPGVIIQINDSDFDYVDAEFLLQDVMYFPLGHPISGQKGVKVSWSEKPAIGAILDSLVR